MQLVQLIIKMNSECRDVVFFIGLSLILAGHFVHSLFFFFRVIQYLICFRILKNKSLNFSILVI